MKEIVIKELLTNKISFEIGKKIFDLSNPLLWYITRPQIENYLKLENTPDYARFVHKPESKLLEENLAYIVHNQNSPLQIIDLGCGDAKKGISLTKKVNGLTKESNIYIPVDISREMLLRASKNLTNTSIDFILNNLNQSNIYNLDALSQNLETRDRLILILGSTFGNYHHINDLVLEIKKNMKDRDKLVIGTGITNEINDIKGLEAAYGGEQNRKFLCPLVECLGITDYSFFVRFNEETRSVEHFFELNESREISGLMMNREDRILTAISIKYSIDDLRRILSEFSTEFYTKEHTYALAVCSLGR